MIPYLQCENDTLLLKKTTPNFYAVPDGEKIWGCGIPDIQQNQVKPSFLTGKLIPDLCSEVSFFEKINSEIIWCGEKIKLVGWTMKRATISQSCPQCKRWIVKL